MSASAHELRRTLKVWFGVFIGFGAAAVLAFLTGVVDTLPSISSLLLMGGGFLVGWVVATKLGSSGTED